MMKTPTQNLHVVDPRTDSRKLVLLDGSTWDSSKHGVVFFESDSYRLYSSAGQIGTLLFTLVEAVHPQCIGLRVSDFRCETAPLFLFEVTRSGSVLAAKTGLKHTEDLALMFDEHGTYQTWTFYGLTDGTQSPATLEPFPQLLVGWDSYKFVLEVDLDGILMGYVNPAGTVDELLSCLKRAAMLGRLRG